MPVFLCGQSSGLRRRSARVRASERRLALTPLLRHRRCAPATAPPPLRRRHCAAAAAAPPPPLRLRPLMNRRIMQRGRAEPAGDLLLCHHAGDGGRAERSRRRLQRRQALGALLRQAGGWAGDTLTFSPHSLCRAAAAPVREAICVGCWCCCCRSARRLPPPPPLPAGGTTPARSACRSTAPCRCAAA
jgi:hypothetical protein